MKCEDMKCEDMKCEDMKCDDMKSLMQNGDVTKCGDVLIFNPFNPDNKEITLNEVQSILNKYGITAKVNNIELYKRAFVHQSYTKRPAMENAAANIQVMARPPDCLDLKTKSNERLEFIGDGVLELITKYYLYRRFPKADEGFMTEKKIALVKNEHIGKVAYDMQINKWLILSKHAEEKKTRTNLKKLGCLFEAFLGALFLDFNKISIKDEHNWFQNVFVTGPGFQMAQIFVENVFETHVDWMKIISTDDNYKNILQVKIQKEFKTTPDYLEISHDVDNGYQMGVYLCAGQSIHHISPASLADAKPFSYYGSFLKIHDTMTADEKVFVFLGSGTHKIKKKAEQIACEVALANLNKST
jgi:dsRNA-specific ribonuclease